MPKQRPSTTKKRLQAARKQGSNGRLQVGEYQFSVELAHTLAGDVHVSWSWLILLDGDIHDSFVFNISPCFLHDRYLVLVVTGVL